MTEWSAALDALEEWVRRLTASAEGTAEDPGSAPELPAGRVPADLVVRALALQCAMVEAASAGRSSQQRRAQQQAYADA